jgi:hypothetical protein
VSEQRISDEILRSIHEYPFRVHSDKVRALAADPLDARRALAAKAQGGAYDAENVKAQAVHDYRSGTTQDLHCRIAFERGAEFQFQQPAPSAPTPEPAPEIQFQGPTDAVVKANKESLDRLLRALADCQAIIGPTIVPLDLGPSYLERLRDKFAVAHAGSGSLPADAYVWADECMKQRDTK